LRLLGEGLLDRTPDDLDSVKEVADFIAVAYWRQSRQGGILPLAVAEPDLLIERTIQLAGEMGITDARLREILKPLAKTRLERGLWRLQEAGIVGQSMGTRTDKQGSLRKQRIWHYKDAL
jgi:hypothetical protein